MRPAGPDADAARRHADDQRLAGAGGPDARLTYRAGTLAAYAALLLGGPYAAVSAYWGLGGTGLLSTIGGTLEREGRAGTTSVRVLLCVAVVLKLAAAVLCLAATRSPRRWSAQRRRRARRAAWIVAASLVLYGGVLTTIGLLVQLDVVHASPNADHTALRWHAYVWDPWFLLWGALLAAGLAASDSSFHQASLATRLRPPARCPGHQ